MAWAGSKEFSTPRPRAVAGISCIRPWAPAGLTARGLKPDSCFATAASSSPGTPVRAAAPLIRSAYGVEAGTRAEIPAFPQLQRQRRPGRCR